MAFAATTEWDVRTTGSDANGGGFNTAATGTDRSQSDAAFQAYTDIVIGGTNTTITSAAHPFDATSPGNIINITGGTGFTIQRVQIVSVAGAVATCDKAVGTAASTGGTGNLGGAFLTIGAAGALVTAGNMIHIKSGTYTLTAAISMTVDCFLTGYGTAHNDGGTKPVITTATNSVDLFQVSAGVFHFRNLSLRNTATTRAIGINANNTYVSGSVGSCVFDGFTQCIGTTNDAWRRMSVIGCEFKNYSSYAVNGSIFPVTVYGCYIHDGGVSAHGVTSSADGCYVMRTIFANIPTNCIILSGNTLSGMYAENTFYGCGQGIDCTGSINNQDIHNNIFYGNAIGIRVQTGTIQGLQYNNAFGGNATANRTGPTYTGPAPNDIVLTVSPFTNAAGGDFTLNSTAGGGAACKGAGFQWH